MVFRRRKIGRPVLGRKRVAGQGRQVLRLLLERRIIKKVPKVGPAKPVKAAVTIRKKARVIKPAPVQRAPWLRRVLVKKKAVKPAAVRRVLVKPINVNEVIKYEIRSALRGRPFRAEEIVSRVLNKLPGLDRVRLRAAVWQELGKVAKPVKVPPAPLMEKVRVIKPAPVQRAPWSRRVLVREGAVKSAWVPRRAIVRDVSAAMPILPLLMVAKKAPEKKVKIKLEQLRETIPAGVFNAVSRAAKTERGKVALLTEIKRRHDEIAEKSGGGVASGYFNAVAKNPDAVKVLTRKDVGKVGIRIAKKRSVAAWGYFYAVAENPDAVKVLTRKDVVKVGIRIAEKSVDAAGSYFYVFAGHYFDAIGNPDAVKVAVKVLTRPELMDDYVVGCLSKIKYPFGYFTHYIKMPGLFLNRNVLAELGARKIKPEDLSPVIDAVNKFETLPYAGVEEKRKSLEQNLAKMKAVGNVAAVKALKKQISEIMDRKQDFIVNDLIRNNVKKYGTVESAVLFSGYVENEADWSRFLDSDGGYFFEKIKSSLKKEGISPEFLGGLEEGKLSTTKGWGASSLFSLLSENLWVVKRNREILEPGFKEKTKEKWKSALEEMGRLGIKIENLEKPWQKTYPVEMVAKKELKPEDITVISNGLKVLSSQLFSGIEPVAEKEIEERIRKLSQKTGLKEVEKLVELSPAERIKLFTQLEEKHIAQLNAAKDEYQSLSRGLQAGFRFKFKDAILRDAKSIGELRSVATEFQRFLGDADAHGFFAKFEKIGDLKERVTGYVNKIPWAGKKGEIRAELSEKNLLTLFINEWDCLAPQGKGPYLGLEFEHAFPWIKRKDTGIATYYLGKKPVGHSFLVAAEVEGKPALVVDSIDLSTDYFTEHADVKPFVNAIKDIASELGIKNIFISEIMSNSAERFAGIAGEVEEKEIKVFKPWEGHSDVFRKGRENIIGRVRRIV